MSKKLVSWEFHKHKFDFSKDLPVTESAWSGHYYFAYDLIANTKPDIVVELGTHRGNSLFSMAQAIKDFNLNTKLHGVDTWEGDKHAGYYEERVYKKFLEVKEKYYKDIDITPHKMYFDEAVKNFEENSIDVLHIDGLHTYEAVKHDFETWLPKVKKDTGIILFHDICVRRKGFGVYKFWAELKKEYDTVQFYHYYGLGVIFLDESTYKEISKKSTLLKAHIRYCKKSLFALIGFFFGKITSKE